MRQFCQKALEPRWKRSYIILLTILTAVKVDCITTWIHCTYLLICSLQKKIARLHSCHCQNGGSKGHSSLQVKINSVLSLLFLLASCTAVPSPCLHSEIKNLNQPYDLTWTVENPETGYWAQLANKEKPLGMSRFPYLTFDLCLLADNSWPDT